MIKYTIYGNNQANLITQINQLDPTMRYVCTIAEFKSNRSLEQNKLLWQFFTDFGKMVGYEGADEIEQLKLMVTLKLHPKLITNKKTGEVIQVPPETSKMKTDEFSEMMDKLIRYTANYGFIFDENT